MLLSMLSMKTKKIVCSLNFPPRKMSLGTCAPCELEIRFYSIIIHVAFVKSEKEDAETGLLEIKRPERVRFNAVRKVDYGIVESVSCQWENGTFEVRDYIDHFMEILNHDRIDELTVTGDDAYPPESIQQLVNGLDIRQLSLSDWVSDNNVKIYLNAIKPSRSFDLDRCSLFDWNHTRMSQFFVQNLDYIVITNAALLTLDDLLLTNVSEIQINRTRMIEKDFNRFLKHWIAGSNPRLKYLMVGGDLTIEDREEYERELLQGIEHRKIPDEEKRTCVRHMGSYAEHMEPFSGGFYIRRKDGTETIVLSKNLFFHLILQELVNV
ncbi:hypothetical protein GCK72_009153 [Caenorhabditis remanei]|uniref:Sdz-33 F-box domain-containing protein n=1 Tax=Caenorhabditis remanei TaxID=31234 RepID=A0A6A5H1L0_CAERE|nr:hypothetical protein GCK72_009153 [Caenorhabditis remanei]KAF1760901.1 hypothetical protein GCK72_009153 [Caenorhabditis remanei]